MNDETQDQGPEAADTAQDAAQGATDAAEAPTPPLEGNQGDGLEPEGEPEPFDGADDGS